MQALASAIAGLVPKMLRFAGMAGFIAVSAYALITILTMLASVLLVALNWGVINDLVALIQMWLPFNIGVVITWILTISFTYIVYRLSVVAINYVDTFFGN